MDLSIIVVSYNTRALLEACLLSVELHLEGKLDYELLVVDNASRDGSEEWLRTFAAGRPRIGLKLLKENRGFGGGNNVAMREAKGRNVLLLNSDAYLVDDSLVAAAAWLDGQPDVFSVTCMLLTGDNLPGPSYGHFPSARTLALELATKRFGRLRAAIPAPDEGTHPVDFPCGAFMLLKGSLLREVGEFDEQSFFMYFEEADLAKRAADRGYRNIYFGPARAVHLGGKSAGPAVKGPSGNPLFYRSWRRYLEKHHGPLSRALARAMLSGYYRFAAMAHALRGNREVAENFRAYRKALREGWPG